MSKKNKLDYFPFSGFYLVMATRQMFTEMENQNLCFCECHNYKISICSDCIPEHKDDPIIIEKFGLE